MTWRDAIGSTCTSCQHPKSWHYNRQHIRYVNRAHPVLIYPPRTCRWCGCRYSLRQETNDEVA